MTCLSVQCDDHAACLNTTSWSTANRLPDAVMTCKGQDSHMGHEQALISCCKISWLHDAVTVVSSSHASLQ